MRYKSLKIFFNNSRGQKLAGILELPEAMPRLFGVFSPCFTCTKESHAAHKVSRALADLDIAMLRFDPTGLGHSEGDFKETSFSTLTLDIIAACHALAMEYDSPKLLIGHSISGTAALVAAKNLPQLQALATIGSPPDPAHIVEKLHRRNLITLKGEFAELMIAGHPVTVRKSFIDDALAQSLIEDTAGYKRKLFVFHAPFDDTVAFENAQVIYDRAGGDKELVALRESATHLLERGMEDAVFIANILRSWFDLHLK